MNYYVIFAIDLDINLTINDFLFAAIIRYPSAPIGPDNLSRRLLILFPRLFSKNIIAFTPANL